MSFGWFVIYTCTQRDGVSESIKWHANCLNNDVLIWSHTFCMCTVQSNIQFVGLRIDKRYQYTNSNGHTHSEKGHSNESVNWIDVWVDSSVLFRNQNIKCWTLNIQKHVHCSRQSILDNCGSAACDETTEHKSREWYLSVADVYEIPQQISMTLFGTLLCRCWNAPERNSFLFTLMRHWIP